MIFYKSLEHLPPPPTHLINKITGLWQERYKRFKKTSDYPNLDFQLLDIDSDSFRTSTFDFIQNIELNNWFDQYIFKHRNKNTSSWVFRFVESYSIKPEGTFPLYLKHLDSIFGEGSEKNTDFVLIYNLTNSIADLVYYKDPDHPIVRKDRPLFTVSDKIDKDNLTQHPASWEKFENAVEIFRCTPPPMTWYISRTNVIHSVENANRFPRVALQLRLTSEEIKLFFPEAYSELT
jgi:hypothetical protein